MKPFAKKPWILLLACLLTLSKAGHGQTPTCADSLARLERAVVVKQIRLAATQDTLTGVRTVLYAERAERKQETRRAVGKGRRQGTVAGLVMALLLALVL